MKSFQIHFSKIISAFLFLLFLLPGVTLAQGFPGLDYELAGKAQLDLNVTPENPQPLQQVTVRASSRVLNTSDSSISWYLNGTLAKTDRNLNTFTFQVGALGSESVIRAVARNDDNEVEETLTIIPGEVDVLWETDTYTPPFYKGKALPTAESDISLVAIPHLGQGSEQNLNYTWSVNFQEVFRLSGFGKKRVDVSTSVFSNGAEYQVVAKNESRGTAAAGQTEIELQDPEIAFYQRDADIGLLYNHAIESGQLIEEDGFEVVAEPYFFSFQNASENIGEYQWEINNNEVDLTGARNALLLNFPESGSGQSRLELRISNPERILQRASHDITFSF